MGPLVLWRCFIPFIKEGKTAADFPIFCHGVLPLHGDLFVAFFWIFISQGAFLKNQFHRRDHFWSVRNGGGVADWDIPKRVRIHDFLTRNWGMRHRDFDFDIKKLPR